MNKVGRRVGCVCAPGADPGPVTLSAAKRPIKEDMIKKLMAFTVMGLLFAPAIRQSPQAGAVWDNVSSYAKSTAAQWGATEGLSASAAPAAAHSVSDGHTHDLEADPVSTGEFTFLGTIDGEAVTWNRCAPIRYVVNQALVDAGINDELLLALADIEAASVFNFEFAGVVTHIPTSDWDARPASLGAPVIFAVAAASQTDLLGNGNIGSGGADPGYFNGEPELVAGLVVLDAAKITNYSSGMGPGSVGAVITHETLHVVGLSHVTDPTSVMTTRLNTGSGRIGPGDIAGLEALAHVASCH